ncbi:MAG TPA: substrate-binding domain-containing protein [Candidatus Sulfotelmatobacter sp.]|nr:substrate-binding domain-containing protein [Candidatus Sulfotelmatobacter sp.]
MTSLLRAAALALATLVTIPTATFAQTAQTAPAALAAIPAGHDDDLRLFVPGQPVVKGPAALAAMPKADLIVWVAGNQFFAMEDLVRTFQTTHPHAAVVVVTLPPGLELDGILHGGFRYEGHDYPGRPDVYATVDLGPLRQLRDAKLATSYATYMHNELTLLVAQGNPKHITGVDDLGRPDVRVSLPNPTNEGIMTYYAKPMLERHGLYAKLVGDHDCQACQSAPNVYLTAVHHRETPERLADGRTDVGIVWKTEAIAAMAAGAKVQAVALPPADNERAAVSYYLTPLTANPTHVALARAYVGFVTAPAGQDVYTKYGFVGADAAERASRPI